MNALTMDVAALTVAENAKIPTGSSWARVIPPNDALDIKDCGCYTTIRKDLLDMSVMKFIYSKVYYLCTTHFFFIAEDLI